MPVSIRAFVCAVVGLLLAGAGGCSMPSLLITPVSSSQKLEEAVVQSGPRGTKIALIEVEGLLVNSRHGSGGFLGPQENKVSLFKQQLDAAARDDRVKAVVLRINSPGGTVSATDLMYELVVDFKRRTGKPVIAACQDVAASGGYYIAQAADEIHAMPTSVVGSIGVLFQTFDASRLMDKVGVSVSPVTSGPHKDMGSPFNGVSEEERAIMQGMVDEFYVRFTNVIRQSREVRDEETAFDGRVFTGEQAYALNLVDEVCQLDQTLSRTRKLIGERRARVILYRRPYGYRGSIYASGAELSPEAQGKASELSALVANLPMVSEIGQALQPGFYYLWMP